MNRFLVCLLVALGWLVVPMGRLSAADRSPNVLLIITDDMGWGDVRSHGNDRIDTPALDRLAAAGARFDRFYVSPVCAPTRASVLTGRYHLRTGVSWVTRGLETMRSEEVTLAELFKPAGYATGCFGKWHNGAHYPHHPNGQGFDEFLGFCGGHWNNYFDTGLERNGEPFRSKGFITDVLTDAALAFIEKHRQQPFLCYLAYNAPHSPFQVPDRYFDKYKERGLDTRTACIHAMVENIDDSLSRLFKKLDELKLTGDTIVLFLTDNGPNTDRFNGGMRGRKGSVHEGGVRVPLFIRWPGRVKAGTTVTQIAAHIDLLPTLADLCGMALPKGLALDGVSLAPLLRGRTDGWPERLLFTHQSRAGQVQPTPGAVRSQRHRLIVDGKGVELYDMIADPAQEKNIAAEHAEIVKKLRTAYDIWYKDVTRRPPERLPIPVGHAQARVVVLPAPESYLEGKVRFKGGSGWAHDWITGWQSTDDSVAWNIDVVRPGRYEVTLLYTCLEGDSGAKLRVEAGGRTVEGVLEKAHDPKPIPSPDRVARGEVVEKEWGDLTPGVLELPRGRTRLVVRALSKPGKEVMDLKGVKLRRLD